MIFFADRNLGNRFPDFLTAAGLRVERHDAHFHQRTRDEEWLAEIAARGWIGLTRDRNIRYRPNELAAVKANRVGLILLAGQAPHDELARNFVATFPRIERFLDGQAPPFIAKLFRASAAEVAKSPAASGKIELWWP